jgi:arabinogalactan oligomer/maltooligosaccharide transport system permease protein
LSEIAEPRAVARGVADTPARRMLRFLLQPSALGLALGLLVATLLGSWFYRQASEELVVERESRIAIIQGSALAEFVTATLTISPDDTAALQQGMQDWVARSEGDDSVRVVRLGGARLLASTHPADLQGELPRRLGKDEKWLFDLGQNLRAAEDTNRSEGVFRKPQIDVSRPAPGRIRISVPYVMDGAIAGFLQHEGPAPKVEAASPPVPALLAVVLPVAAFLLIALLVTRSVDEPAGGRRWVVFGVALALLVATLLFYSTRGAESLAGQAVAGNQQVAAAYEALRARVPVVDGVGGMAEGGDANPWDVDLFQRPRGLLTREGAVIEETLSASVAAFVQPFSRALWGNLGIGAVILAFFGLGLARRLRETISRYRYAYLYVTPAMVGMLILVFFPFAYGIALSFTGQTIFNTNVPLTDLWVGVQNYIDILGDFGVARQTDAGWVIDYQNFYWTLFITICWTVSNVTVGVTLGMLLALALNTPGLRFKPIYRVLLILPWAIPNYITALIWKALFHQQFGAINQAIQMFGGEPVAWFDGVFSSFMTGLATNGWLSFPFMMVVILGGLQSISQDMYEAATVEGATRWQQFWRITLPLLKPTLVPAVILSVVWTFNMFNVIYLVSGGQPAGANEILITKAYKIAFEEYRYAYSAAYSTVIFLILLVYGVFQTRMTRATEAVHA